MTAGPPRQQDPPKPRKENVPTPLDVAVRVLSLARTRKPADAVLREELRAVKGLPRTAARSVAEFVFSYYRWRGLVNPSHSWVAQIQEAQELAQRFQSAPASFTDSELARVVPDWVASEMSMSRPWLESLQTRPVLWLRGRPGKADPLSARLADCDSPESLAADALRYLGEKDLFRTAEFQAGDFEIQDLASQLVSILASPEPGEVWWDACAGEGGKSLHLADLMNNRGVVWATDRADWRLKRLRLRAARAGLHNIRWAHWEGRSDLPVSGLVDGVVVDAPCSGLGTWQRNPDARWSVTTRDVEELATLQVQLLRHTSRALRSGGRLIYSVCTLTEKETTAVAAQFSAHSPDFEPLAIEPRFRRGASSSELNQVCLWPQDWGGNGMFIAAWRKRKGGDKRRRLGPSHEPTVAMSPRSFPATEKNESRAEAASASSDS